jgi:lipoate-protein ligase A
MKYLRLNTTDPYYNLAVEEFLFSHTDEDVFMLWQNASTVVIGKNQNAYAEVDLDYARTNKIKIARRITGGGAVYHDLGNINYSYITSQSNISTLDFETPSRAMIAALASMGIDAALGGRNDILVGDKKISGNAQYSSNGRILHHGTLLFDADGSVMERVLRVDKEKLTSHGVSSHKSRVANIKSILQSDISVEDFISTLEKHIKAYLDPEELTLPNSSVINELAARNASEEWILSNKKFLTSYSVTRQKRYPFGRVTVNVNLNRDVIEKIMITGDFFSSAPIEELEDALTGKKISDLLLPDVSKYIASMTNEEFCSLLRGQ